MSLFLSLFFKMDTKKYLSEFSKDFEAFSKKMFSRKVKEALKIDSVATGALRNLENYLVGGKKVRPALTSLGYKIAGGKENKKIMPACFAVELMHNSLLIHDDYVDNDETRRGKPTLHKVYLNKNGEHYAVSMAIITADVGIFWANEILSGSDFAPKVITKAVNLFNHFLLNTGYGELMDIDFDFHPLVSWNDILNVRIYKTAYYTFIMPLTIGAVLGGASDGLLKNLENFGLNVGLAFQLRDDVLGVFGDSGETGKSNESDIREGKKSLLYFKALELTSKSEKDFLKKYYGNVKTKDQIEKIRKIIKDSGAFDYSGKLAKDYVEIGKKIIPRITKNGDLQETLSTLVDYMIERNK